MINSLACYCAMKISKIESVLFYLKNSFTYASVGATRAFIPCLGTNKARIMCDNSPAVGDDVFLVRVWGGAPFCDVPARGRVPIIFSLLSTCSLRQHNADNFFDKE